MVAAVAADEADAVALLEREHAPPVDLLLVDPAVAVERLADLRRRHRRVGAEHGESVYLARLWRALGLSQQSENGRVAVRLSAGVTNPRLDMVGQWIPYPLFARCSLFRLSRANTTKRSSSARSTGFAIKANAPLARASSCASASRLPETRITGGGL